jgi:hypothetical protein
MKYSRDVITKSTSLESFKSSPGKDPLAARNARLPSCESLVVLCLRMGEGLVLILESQRGPDGYPKGILSWDCTSA